MWIDRPADEVYAFAADPDRLPQWAAGLSSGLGDVAAVAADLNQLREVLED